MFGQMGLVTAIDAGFDICKNFIFIEENELAMMVTAAVSGSCIRWPGFWLSDTR